MSVEAQREIAEGNPDKGAEICRTLIREWTSLQGPDGERVLVWRGFLGKALIEAHRYREAEEVLASLLVDRERLLGPDDLSVLTTRGNLARAIALGGRPDEARFHAQTLLHDRMRLLGPDHPSTLDAAGHIAHFCYLAGDFSLAAHLYERLLEDRIRILGPDHPDVFQTEHNYAAARAKSGELDDVEELAEFAHELQDELGFEHHNTLNAFALLADALTRAGELDQALRVANIVLDGRSRILGDRDAKTLLSRTLVVRILNRLGRLEEATRETTRVVRLHADAGRDDEITGLHVVVDTLAHVADTPGARLRQYDQDLLLDLVQLTHWIDEQARDVELAVEYREVSARARSVLVEVLTT